MGMNLAENTRAQAEQSIPLRGIGQVNVDVHPVRGDLRRRDFLEPDANTAMRGHDHHAIIRRGIRLLRMQGIAKHLGPEPGDAALVVAVEHDVT